MLNYMIDLPGKWSDQCVINSLWKRNWLSWKDHVMTIPLQESKIVQCRWRCEDMKPLCCDSGSWLEHWPAHSSHDLFFRIVERLTGTSVLTNITGWVACQFCRS